MKNLKVRRGRTAPSPRQGSIRRGLCLLICTTLFAALLTTLLTPYDAEAVPAFARKVGRNCTYCHTLFPKLNETGRIFLSGGFRFSDEDVWEKVKDLKTIPVAFEVELEGLYNNTTASGVRTESSNVLVEEIEIIAGGAFGKAGRLSAIGSFAIEQSDSGTSTTYDAKIGDAFIQINDLIGPTGAARLNIRAGQTHLALPFLGGHQRFIHNAYQANSTLGLFSTTARVIELNGIALTSDDESLIPTHRWSAGISRDSVNDDNKLSGIYAGYSFNIKEAFSAGVLYRSGKEQFGTIDTRYNRYGVGAESELGPVILTGGFFLSDREERDSFKNYLLEALYMPLAKVSLGARIDVVAESGKEKAKGTSLMVRYDILANAYTLLEYRGLTDDDLITGSNEDEEKLRLMLVILF